MTLEKQIKELIDKHMEWIFTQDHRLKAIEDANRGPFEAELAALVRERERAAYYKGFFDKMFDNNMLADENPNKEQPK